MILGIVFAGIGILFFGFYLYGAYVTTVQKLAVEEGKKNKYYFDTLISVLYKSVAEVLVQEAESSLNFIQEKSEDDFIYTVVDGIFNTTTGHSIDFFKVEAKKVGNVVLGYPTSYMAKVIRDNKFDVFTDKFHDRILYNIQKQRESEKYEFTLDAMYKQLRYIPSFGSYLFHLVINKPFQLKIGVKDGK